MQNYQNTPRVSTDQNQSRIQSLTFSQLSQLKTVQKIRKVNRTSIITKQSKNPTMDSKSIQQFQQSITQANKQQYTNHHKQSINQYNKGYAPNKQKISHNKQISHKQ